MTNLKSKWSKKRIIWWKVTLWCTTKMFQSQNFMSKTNSRSWIIHTLRLTQLKSGEWRKEDLHVGIHRSQKAMLLNECRRLDQGKHLCHSSHRWWNRWAVDRRVHRYNCRRGIRILLRGELRLKVRVRMEEIEASEGMVRSISTTSFRVASWIWVGINLEQRVIIPPDEDEEDNCLLSIKTNYKIKLICSNKRLVLCIQTTRASSKPTDMPVQLLQYFNNFHILVSVRPLVIQE